MSSSNIETPPRPRKGALAWLSEDLALMGLGSLVPITGLLLLSPIAMVLGVMIGSDSGYADTEGSRWAALGTAAFLVSLPFVNVGAGVGGWLLYLFHRPRSGQWTLLFPIAWLAVGILCFFVASQVVR